MIQDHQKLQQENKMLHVRHWAHIKNEVIYNLQQPIHSHIKKIVVSDHEIEDLIDDVFDNKSDPLTISLSLIEKSQNNSETE